MAVKSRGNTVTRRCRPVAVSFAEPPRSGYNYYIGFKPLGGPHTINIIDSTLDSDGVIDRVL